MFEVNHNWLKKTDQQIVMVVYSHSVKVVDGTLKISHEAVHITDGWVSGGILWDEDQSLPVVFESLFIFPAQ